MTGNLYIGGTKVCPVVVVSKEGLPREVSSGVYGYPTADYNFSLPSDATGLGDYALYNAFRGNTKIRNVDLSSLTSASGNYSLVYCFYNATRLLSVNMQNVTTASSMTYMCNGCTALTSLNFSSLTTAENLSYTFDGCSALTTVSMPNLTTCPTMMYCFRNNTNLTSLSLPKLKGTVDTPCTISYLCYYDRKLETLDISKLEYATAMVSAFYSCRKLEELDLSSLKNITASAEAFANDCINLKTVRLSALTNVAYQGQFKSAFNNCQSLENVYFDNLVQIGDNSTANNNNSHFQQAFLATGAYNLIDVTFPKLEKIYCNGANTSSLGTFWNCPMLRKLYFPKLDTISFYPDTASIYQHACKYIFHSCSNLTELHFAAANQAAIEASPGYSTRWGRGINNVTVYFDL